MRSCGGAFVGVTRVTGIRIGARGISIRIIGVVVWVVRIVIRVGRRIWVVSGSEAARLRILALWARGRVGIWILRRFPSIALGRGFAAFRGGRKMIIWCLSFSCGCRLRGR